MGWFLSRKSKSGKGKRGGNKRGGARQTRFEWDPERTKLAVKWSAGVLAVVGLVAGWHYGKQALVDYVSASRAAKVSPEDVTLVEAPSWVSQATRHRLRRRVAERISPDPMDGQSLRRAAAALHEDPLVRRGQVRRVGGGQVQVTAAYRQPVAVIEARDGYHLVGPEGTRLSPTPYYAHQVSALGLPVIVRGRSGVRSAPPPAGRRWQGEPVQAALSLVRLLREERYFDQIQQVNVSRRDERGRLRLVLHTDDGRIRWGFPPGRERAIEPAAEVKLGRLRQLAQAYHGNIDAGGQTIEIFGATTQTAAGEPIQSAQAGVNAAGGQQ